MGSELPTSSRLSRIFAKICAKFCHGRVLVVVHACRRQDLAAAFPQANSTKPGSLSKTLDDNRIAVSQENTFFP
jgi:hypothetical protein